MGNIELFFSGLDEKVNCCWKCHLIYVDDFNELMDVYNKIKSPITYREVKKNVETIFLITDGDNAWIYKMVNMYRIKKEKNFKNNK